MCECAPSGSMPIGGHWALRGGFAPRANPRRPNAHFPPPQDMFRQQRGDLFVSFYHRSQESAKMCDAMKRRTELAYEQRRKSEANRLQKSNNGSVMRYLERIPLTMNVTLTIEIPNAEHAGMIERMEAWCDADSIPQIMHDTGVLIQFPDLVPDVKNANDFVNRVTLTGPLAKVEEARIRIRNFTPVAVSFPLRTLKANILEKDVKSVIDKAIAEKLINFPNLEIMVQLPQVPRDQVPSCVVRGAPSQEREICDACTALHRLLFDAANDNEHSSAVIYSTMMDIPAVQQLAVTGVPDGFLIRLISLETNAVIYFPTVADRHFGATVFYLYGSVRAIMQARKYIQGLLPVRLIFDVENNDLLNPVDASNRELFLRDTERDLTITMKKSRLEGEKLTENDSLRNMVIIESEEYNLTNVYAMRHQLFRNGVLEDEPLIVTNDFDFFERDFKALIAKNNQTIAESLSTSDSLAKTSSLLYSRLPQGRPSSLMSPMAVLSSPVISEVTELLPRLQTSQEILRPSGTDNKPVTTPADDNSISQGRTAREISAATAPSPSAPKEQNTPSDMVNMSVPQFLDLFRNNENKNNVMDGNQTSLAEAPVPRKVECARNVNDTAVDHSFQPSEGLTFDAVAAINNSSRDSTHSTIAENISGTKYLSEKLPVCTRSFSVTPQSQGLMSSGTNVVDALINEQGCATVAVAAAMLQNSPPQWFQSAGTVAVLKSNDYFGRMPRTVERKAVAETFAKPADSTRSSRANSPDKAWHIKKNLPLKSSYVNENYGRECHREVSTSTYPRNTSQGMLARGSKETSSDVRLSPLSGARNTMSPYSTSRGNSSQSSAHYQYRLPRQNSDSTGDFHNYRSERQPMRNRDSTVWENSRHPPSLFEAHPNTREILSRRYQGRLSQNSLRSNDGMRGGGRSIRQSMNQSGGYHSTFSRSQSAWSLSSLGNNEGKRYGNRTITHLHLKRQFVNGVQLEEKGKGDRREERRPSFQQDNQQRNRTYDENKREERMYRRDPEGMKNAVNESSSERTKTYADITKRVDVMTLIDEVQRRPALMMKELEKYTGNDKSSSKSYADMAKKSTAKEEKVQSKTPNKNQSGNEQSPKAIVKEYRSDG